MMCLIQRLTAALAVVAVIGLAPSRAAAEIQILVQEFSGNTVVGTASFTEGTPTGTGIYAQSFTYSGAQLSIVSGAALTNSHLNALPASLSSNFGVAVLVDNPTNTLKITVTDDGYTAGSGFPTIIRNTASVSIATDGAAQVASFSSLLATPLTFPSDATSGPPTGSVLGGPTPEATDARPDTVGESPITTALVSSLPDQYALQQVITISIPAGVSTPANTSFNGTAGVTATPIPAPSGLALALFALPLIGLRRAFRRRDAAV
jgi:hypothetical protein